MVTYVTLFRCYGGQCDTQICDLRVAIGTAFVPDTVSGHFAWTSLQPTLSHLDQITIYRVDHLFFFFLSSSSFHQIFFALLFPAAFLVVRHPGSHIYTHKTGSTRDRSIPRSLQRSVSTKSSISQRTFFHFLQCSTVFPPPTFYGYVRVSCMFLSREGLSTVFLVDSHRTLEYVDWRNCNARGYCGTCPARYCPYHRAPVLQC